jgi:oxygen-independent coproporphyrinogen-3 oxidase
MGLRLSDGLDVRLLERLGGVRPSEAAIDGLVGLGLIERSGPTRIAATRDGRMVLNAVVAELSGAFEKVAPQC